MDGHGNGHEAPFGEMELPFRDRFVEDEEGATIDSGPAVCRFNAQRGGRIERWQWRTVPPLAAMRPHHGQRSEVSLNLVDTAHGSLIDHFLPLGTKPEEIADGTHHEFGDFVDGAFKKQVVDSGGEIRIGLLRDGEIRAGQRVAEVRMAKSAALRPGSSDLSALYRVINSSLRPLQILFAVEFNLIAPGLDNPFVAGSDGYYLMDGVRPENDPSLGSMGVSPNATHVALVNPDGEMALQLGWDRECDLWRMPGQGGGPSVRLLAVWRIQLPPRDNWAMGLWLAPG